MSLRRIAHNTIIQFLAKIISVGFGVVTVGLMARSLGQEGFGQYVTIIAFLQFFAILVDFGLQLSMVNLMSNPLHNPTQIFNNTLTLRIISAVGLFLFAPLVAMLFPYPAVIKQGIIILIINFVALAINQVLIGLFQRELKMDKLAIAEIIGKIILLIGVWLTVAKGWGLFGMLIAINISTLAQVGIGFLYSLKLNRPTWAFDWQIWNLIISASWPIAISIAFNLIYFKADTIILSLIRTQTEVGIYGAPYRALEILTTFPYLFVGLLFPFISVAWARQDFENYKFYFQRTFDALVIIALPLIAGTLPLAERIMVLIAGKDFSASAPILQILIFATAIIFVNVIFGYSIVILGKQKQLIWGYIATAAISLILYLIFIPKFSYFAAAYITILSELMIFTINVIVSIRTSKYIPKLTVAWKSLLASVMMSGFILLIYRLPLLIILPLATIVYFVILYGLKGIQKETVLEILKAK